MGIQQYKKKLVAQYIDIITRCNYEIDKRTTSNQNLSAINFMLISAFKFCISIINHYDNSMANSNKKLIVQIDRSLRRIIITAPNKVPIENIKENVPFIIFQILHLKRQKEKIFRQRLRQLINKMCMQNELLACTPRTYFPGGQDYLNLLMKYK